MQEIFDETTNLLFKIYKQEDLIDANQIKFYQDQINIINDWSDDNDIKEYIIKDMKLGDFFSYITKFATSYENKLIYKHILVFDKGSLIGTLVVTINNDEFKETLNEDCQYDEIRNDKDPLFMFEYIAVNPSLRNKGYATKIINGVKNNQQIIADNTKNCGMIGVIHNNNEGSKKAFLKNKFICAPAKAFLGQFKRVDKDFRVYYTGKHEKIFEIEK